MDEFEFQPGPLVPDLPAGFLSAGRDYHNALMSLGLYPEISIWARDHDIDEWVLLICTSMTDGAGQLRIMDVLFKAYDISATPASIDPFLVRLDSPSNPIMKMVWQSIHLRQPATIYTKTTDGREVAAAEDRLSTEVSVGPLHFKPTWSYIVATEHRHNQKSLKSFKDFKAAVERQKAA